MDFDLEGNFAKTNLYISSITLYIIRSAFFHNDVDRESHKLFT